MRRDVMLRSRPAVAGVCLVMTVWLAGCSDGTDGTDTVGDPGRGDVSSLLGALSQVRGTDQARGFVEYGNVAEVARLVGQDETRFRELQGYGYSTVAPSAAPIRDELGLDVLEFDAAMMVGQPPEWGSVLWGDYDVAAVDERFDALGVSREDLDGATLWTSAGDYEMSLEDGPLTGVVRLNEFNSVRTAEGMFGFGPARETVEWVTDAGEQSLADDPVTGGLATCLGDVVAAMISRADGDTATYAVGVRAASADEVTEVVCVAPDDPASAAELRDHAAGELADGQAPSTGGPWSELLPDGEVALTGDGDEMVVLTARPGAQDPVGRVMQLVARGDVAGLFGM